VAGCTFDGMTMPPTPFPTTEPTIAPSPPPTPPQCLVNVANDQCDSVLGNVVPSEDCDCYQFCNGEQLPCCEAGKPCPISCEGDLVAGCRLPESPTAAPMEMCMLSVNTKQCESMTETQTPVEDCDCYNYCDGVYLGCCGFGEFCGITCASNLVAGCEMEEKPPLEMCAVRSHPEACDALLQTVTPETDCDCYDFCDGTYVGCCEYGEFCGHICSANETSVSGCQFEKTEEPTVMPTEETQPPTTRPTAIPTEETKLPTTQPTAVPTATPTQGPTEAEPTRTPFFFWPPGFS